MKMHRASVVLVLAVALTGCGATTYTREDLPRLVLQQSQAPEGTQFVHASSGYKSLEEYAKDDQIKKVALQNAGYVTSYFTFFLSPRFYGPGKDGTISTEGSLADSFVLLFETPEGASKGLQIVEEAVRRDGKDLRDRPADDIGDEAIGIKGTLQVGLPPGYLFAWREGNVVLGLVAAGAPDNINEQAVRVLVDQMRARRR